MTFGQYLWDILVSIAREILSGEPMGIIRFENQLVMAVYAYCKVWLIHYMPVLIMVAAIIFMIGSAVFGRTRPHMPRGILHRVFGTLFRVFINIIFAWIFLIYGAVAGHVNGNNGENNATISYTRRIHTGPIWNVVHSFTRLSLHFYLGRGIFRLFYRILGYIPRLREDGRVREYIARALTLLVILWGFWKIPADWTL